MSSETPFHTFINLIECDQQIHQLMLQKKALDVQNEQFEKERSATEQQAKVSQSKWITLKKEVDARELEMKVLDGQEAEKKRRLEHATDYKMYQALKSEIAQIKLAQHNLEEGIIAAWDDLESAKREYDTQSTALAQKDIAIDSALAQNTQKSVEIDAQIEQLHAKRDTLEKQIPDEWRDKYTMMRARVPNPVVPVINGICSACFYRVLDQDILALTHRKLLQCKDCFRLLYLPEAMQ